MALIGRIAGALRRYAAAQAGTAAVTFALSVVPVLVAGGVAVDYLRYASARTEVQAALDSGALAAAASSLPIADRIAAGKAAFAANMHDSLIDGAEVKVAFAIKGGTVAATADVALPSAFMQLVGLPTMEMRIRTQITTPDKKKAEIALVLDYSGSMTEVLGAQVKYVAMKNAAKKLVSDLVAANPKNVKFALVPFSHHVWVSLPMQYVRGQTGTGTWTGCTQDRTFPYNLSDDTPNADEGSKWGQPISTLHASQGCGAYVPNRLTVRPLTNDFVGITSQLDAMKPYAWTHIALGAEFGFHVLSPNAPFTGGADYTDTTTRKFMVLLTDGMQTEPAFGPGVRNVVQGEKNLTQICANAKVRGITIMTVAYNIDDAATRDRLKTCASDPARDFFEADDDQDIARAFEEIKKQITARVYISK